MPCREPAASLHCLPAAIPPLELGKEFPTEGAFELAAWTQAGQEGFRWTNHGSTANSLALRCCEAHVARSDKDDRKGCMYVATARRKGAGKPWVVVRLNTEHTCDPDVRKGKIESNKEHAKQKCTQLQEQPRKVQPMREKKRKLGTVEEEESDGEQETQIRRTKPRQAKGKLPEEWSFRPEKQAAKHSDSEESEDAGDEALDKEVPYPRPRELREFIDECIENGQTSIPLPDEKFDCAVDILAQLFAYAETHNSTSEPGSFQLEIQRNERGVWTLAEKIMHHKHDGRVAKTIEAVQRWAASTWPDGQEAEEEAKDESHGADGAERGGEVVSAAEEKKEDRKEASPEMEVAKEEEQVQVKPATSEALKFDFVGSTPQEKDLTTQEAAETPPAPTHPLNRSDAPSPPPKKQRLADLISPGLAKKPRLTIDTEVNGPKQHPPLPRNDFLSFDHLDSELGTLPFKDFLLGVAAGLPPKLTKPQLVLLVNRLLIEKGGITSVSLLARLAAFEEGSLDAFVELFNRSPLGGVDHSPLVLLFVKALKKAVAQTQADTAQLA
ncbi:Proteophosphoglycan ppg4 [Rhodotorula toruloides ATCC 204091]|uniref:Proteophosphoglycan ppg4 n=1 Tax=Rhodotorula toruloides TaxID=5286 RepID=A0A0K3CI35_RHOTO|nr:Proteophosphoglycan ppg4 [Rhodotorula toruloides ATCC 204091]KAK4332706.1 Proteophosphoglycan ppg4 [Rhodotorula toruloides]PRQ73992.1 Proteophosphoglycan ppg4 [Rhodotorula toruloides]